MRHTPGTQTRRGRFWAWLTKPDPKSVERNRRAVAKRDERLARIDQKSAEKQQAHAVHAEQRQQPLTPEQKTQRNIHRSSNLLMWASGLQIAALIAPLIIGIVLFVVLLILFYAII